MDKRFELSEQEKVSGEIYPYVRKIVKKHIPSNLETNNLIDEFVEQVASGTVLSDKAIDLVFNQLEIPALDQLDIIENTIKIFKESFAKTKEIEMAKCKKYRLPEGFWTEYFHFQEWLVAKRLSVVMEQIQNKIKTDQLYNDD